MLLFESYKNQSMENLTMEHKAQEIVFTGRKPSKAQIIKRASFIADSGASLIDVFWGENGFTLDKSNGSWSGYGWIKDISADSIASSLNSSNGLKTSFSFLLRGQP